MIQDQTINGVPAPVIAEAVEEIAAKHGMCHPSMLVAKAKAKRSPLHPLFDWNDTTAAEQWRIHTARRVINSVRVVVADTEDPVPAFVHVSKATEEGVMNGYLSSRVAVRSEYRGQVLDDVLRQLIGLQQRYSSLGELKPVWDALDDVKAAA